MEIKEAKRRLALFKIADDRDEDAVGDILARLLVAGSLSMGELQTARDIMRRRNCGNGFAYIFLAAMFISQRSGNAFLRTEKGAALLKAGGYLEEDKQGRDSNDGHGRIVESAWDKAVLAAADLDGDVVVKKSDVVGDCWFFQRNLLAVEALSEGFAALAKVAAHGTPLTEAELEAATGFEGFKLNPAQIDAVKMTAEHRFVVVTGGPGTGKTTIVCAILRALMAQGLEPDEIELVAPTGRAAQRMGEALRNQCASAKDLDGEMRRKIESLDGKTIHSLLGGYPPNWKYTAENKLPLKLVVVDESSMVDVHLIKALVAALPPDCRLVLLGDKDQLPSVEAGALLGDLVGNRDAPFVVRLTESKRFTEEFAECAKAVNDGEAQKFADLTAELDSGNGQWLATFDSDKTKNKCFRCLLAKDPKPSVCHDRLLGWAEYYGLLDGGALVKLASDPRLKDDGALTDGESTPKAKAIFDELDRSRILTVVRKGPHGASGVNELLVKARFGGRLPFNPLEKAGVPVIVTRNTPSRKLWNGDVGVTVKGRSGMVVIFPRGDEVVSCPVGLLPEHELAYAMTVHKSQGSEFENVMVVLPNDQDHPLLNRQIVYTGITRAKKRAVILGTEAALKQAISKKLERDTGLTLSATAGPVQSGSTGTGL
ncbi:MAG: exodeoxyribonuclease V subunit alpha [Kiritimatiellae bacterium]|nr:exodeoxyribonuclease V subunit alpha [Kiritimatiellia bacterium]